MEISKSNPRVKVISHGTTVVYDRIQEDVVKEYLNNQFQPGPGEGFYTEKQANQRIKGLLERPGYELSK